MMDDAAKESAEKATLGMVRNLMESTGLPKDKAMDALKIPESQRKELSALL